MNIQNNSFNGYHNREAVLVENKIVYFGNWHKKATFVLERDEQSEQLKVVKETKYFSYTEDFTALHRACL